MKQLALLFLIVFAGTLAGCSSLPKHPAQNSELFTRAASYSKMGNRNFNSGHYDKAATFFEQALAIHASVDDRAGVSRSLTSLGRIDLAQSNTGAAEKKFQRALKSITELQRPDLAAHALAGLSAASLQKNDPQTALQWIEDGLNLPLADSCSERAVLFHDQGVAYQKLQYFEESEASYHHALAMHESINDIQGIASDCYSLAHLFESTGSVEKAIPFAKRALDLDKKCENSSGIAEDLTLLGLLHTQNGSHEIATDYYQRAQLTWQALGQHAKSEAITTQTAKTEEIH